MISLKITDSNRDTGRVNMTHTDLLTNKERRLDFELRYYKSYVKAKNDTEESHKSGGLYIFKTQFPDLNFPFKDSISSITTY